jgi:hypothetical protein
MAVTIIAEPRTQFNPAYNPLVYVVNSNLKSNPSFRYIVEILSATPVAGKIAELKIAPRTGDGYGYVDISGILKNYVDKALQFGTIDYDASLNTSFRYTLRFSEEFLFSANYTGVFNLNGFMCFQFASAHGVPTSSVGLSFRAENGFSPYPDSRQNINGTWTIKSVPNSLQIETTVPWGLVTGNPISAQCPGTFTYLDRRVTRAKFSLSRSGWVFNVALDTDQYKTHVDSAVTAWQDDSAQGELLTNLPLTGFTATLGQHLYIHSLDVPSNNADWIYFKNSNGAEFRRAYSSSLPVVKGFAVGPGNYGAVTLVSGAGGLIEPSTEWYEFWVANTAGTWLSKKYRIDLDRRCRIEDIQILFMDRKSSWGSYAFQLRKLENVTTEKTLWRKEIPKVITPGWVTMDRADSGLSVLHSKIKKTWQLNTNWMNDAMSVYFEELLSSPYCYINFGDGKWYSCLVEDGTYQTLRYKNERLIRKTISCYASLDTPVQDAGTITPYIGQGFNLRDGFQGATPADLVLPVGNFGVSLG